MKQLSIEEWLPLRGRWLRYVWIGLLRGFLACCFLWTFRLIPYPHMRPFEKGQRALAKVQTGNFKTAVELYRVDHDGQPPTTRQGLRALLHRPAAVGEARRWKGPCQNDVTSVPLDPWQNAYVYQSPGPEGELYSILSHGADGKPGGDGDNEDIESASR